MYCLAYCVPFNIVRPITRMSICMEGAKAKCDPGKDVA